MNNSQSSSDPFDGDDREGAGNGNTAVDLFDDLSRFRVTSWDDGVTVEKVLTTVPVRRPGRREFFRVCPDPAFSLDTVIFEREDGFDRERYMVVPELHVELGPELKLVRLHLCVERRGSAFLWDCRLPRDEGGGRGWHVSALQVAEAARSRWVRMVGNKVLGAYEYHVARNILDEPKWPDKSMGELCRIAFSGRIIDSFDHDVLKELRGEV